MSLLLPKAGQQYDGGNEAQTRAALEQADIQNIKRTSVLTKLQFRDTVTGAVHTVTVTNGALVVT